EGRPFAMEERHRRVGKAKERGRKGLWDCGQRETEGVEGGRSRTGGESHPGSLRAGPRDVRRRLAGLHDDLDLPAMGRGAETNRQGSQRRGTEETVPRQCREVLWVEITPLRLLEFRMSVSVWVPCPRLCVGM